MDDKLLEKMNLKIKESLDAIPEIKSLAQTLKDDTVDEKSFSLGILIGRLYNSFYYQSRRILKRNPTESEFLEFVQLLKQHRIEFMSRLDL